MVYHIYKQVPQRSSASSPSSVKFFDRFSCCRCQQQWPRPPIEQVPTYLLFLAMVDGDENTAQGICPTQITQEDSPCQEVSRQLVVKSHHRRAFDFARQFWKLLFHFDNWYECGVALVVHSKITMTWWYVNYANQKKAIESAILQHHLLLRLPS